MPLTSLSEGGSSEKDSWKPLCTNKKQKGLGSFQCVNIWRGGISARREAEFSKFKESRLERKISCSLWASLKEDGGAVPPRGSPRALCQVPVLGATRPTGGLGRRCSARGPEVCANLRQFAGRHFNCGFPHHRGPLAALREGEGGGVAPFVFFLAFSRLSPGSYPPSPPLLGALGGLLSGLFPQGLPGSSHPVGRGCLCLRSHAGASPLAQECLEPLANTGA